MIGDGLAMHGEPGVDVQTRRPRQRARMVEGPEGELSVSEVSNAAQGATRRAFLASAVAGAVCSAATRSVGLSFGTYGLWMLSSDDALELVGRTGYDGVEIALMPGWPTEPRLLSTSVRSRLRHRLGDLGMRVPAVVETLLAMDPEQSRADNLDRIRRATDLGVELSPGRPPILETVLGRKSHEWETVKQGIVDEVGEWAQLAAERNTVICFKPHAGHAVNNVERSLWLIEQVGSPNFRCTYDYSHLWLQGLDLVPSLEDLLPVSPYIHLKDAEGVLGEHRYLLPGDGETDYLELFRQLLRHDYVGFATVEVSSHIHRRRDYQPIATARLCYQRMSVAFEAAGLTRP